MTGVNVRPACKPLSLLLGSVTMATVSIDVVHVEPRQMTVFVEAEGQRANKNAIHVITRTGYKQ